MVKSYMTTSQYVMNYQCKLNTQVKFYNINSIIASLRNLEKVTKNAIESVLYIVIGNIAL
jgi:hypothetical protein